MRKSIIAGLTLSALAAFAGPSHAYTSPPPAERPVVEQASLTKPAKPVRHARKQSSRIVEEAPKAESLRIPEHPVIRDCIHVFFPQCGSRGSLNDGTFKLPY
jgi:hypothetical protein